jgi:hypothetical protein
MWRAAAFVLVSLAVLTGCSGSGGGEPQTAATAPTAPLTDQEAVPSPATTGDEAVPGTTSRMTMEAVVRAWSRALNAGDNDALARLFALPALIAQGDRIGEFTTYEEIAMFHSGLPCSGTVVEITFGTDEALAVFELGDRGDVACDAAPGQRAAARFVFRGGKIVAWQQVPVPGEEPGQTGTTPQEA